MTKSRNSHPTDCPCIVCNPTLCRDCGLGSPGGTHLRIDGRCKHRRACEARQMLNRGEPIEKAVAHAQRLSA